MRQNRDLEDFFRRVQMTLNNRGGGGGGRFETSQRTTAPATGTSFPAPNPSMTPAPVRYPGGRPGMGMPSTDNPGFTPAPVRFPDGRAGVRPPTYTTPGMPSPEPRPPVYDQIHRGNQGAPGMWNENTGMVNPPAPQRPIQTRQLDPRMRQPNYRQF